MPLAHHGGGISWMMGVEPRVHASDMMGVVPLAHDGGGISGMVDCTVGASWRARHGNGGWVPLFEETIQIRQLP